MSELTRYPKQGMYFEQARSRALRFAKNDKMDKKQQERLVNSLCNQVRLHDGEDAVKELQKEILVDTNNHSTNTLGYSPIYSKQWDNIFKGSG